RARCWSSARSCDWVGAQLRAGPAFASDGGMTRGRHSVGKGHLESHLRRAMAEDPRLNVLDVAVKIIDRRVYLRGHVTSEQLGRAEQSTAGEVGEGRPVENCLLVQQTENVKSEPIK